VRLRALQDATGTPRGAHISVDKRLPAQAGMGGGSSDAASTLLALNRLWGTRLPLAQLETIGLSLGADVPFFLRGRNAWVEGIGEKITPLDLPPARFVVAKPKAGLDTRSIFTDPALKRDSDTATIAGFAADPYAFGRNDLQSVAERLCPEMVQALQWLGSQGLQGRMTGSGSAVFARLPAGQASGRPEVAGWQVRECGNMAVHPLAGWAASDDSSVGG
jgi:4-diphosphocytidyl-2-C-methyl-D-erythritol kinase